MDQDTPESDAPLIPDVEHLEQVMTEKLDEITDLSRRRIWQMRRISDGIDDVRNKLDRIADRMVQAPNPILGDPPKAPTGTRMKRGRS